MINGEAEAATLSVAKYVLTSFDVPKMRSQLLDYYDHQLGIESGS